MTTEEIRALFAECMKRVGSKATRFAVLQRLCIKAWCAETADPGFSQPFDPHMPAQGQNDVTALVVNDLCGGTIYHAVNGVYQRYYNWTHESGNFDVATVAGQEEYGSAWSEVHREQLLADESKRIRERYELLRERVIAAMRNALAA